MDHVSTWAAAHGLPVATVDGNDVEAVFRAAQKGIAHIRATREPYFIETYTYRLRGHYEPDDQGYVDQAELAAWREQDPIDRLLKKLNLGDTELRAINERVAARIEAAWDTAAAAPYPTHADLMTDVYA
jgi:pyruvate dehydrogenase E1 component alpha subunit